MGITFAERADKTDKTPKLRGRPLSHDEGRNTHITCTVGPAQAKALVEHAERLNVPRSEIIRRAVELYLNQKE